MYQGFLLNKNGTLHTKGQFKGNSDLYVGIEHVALDCVCLCVSWLVTTSRAYGREKENFA